MGEKQSGGTPEQAGQDHRYLGMKDAEEREVRGDEAGFFKIQEEAIKKGREDSFTSSESDFTEYRARPLGQTIGCGILAVAFLGARFWFFPLMLKIGNPLGQNLGWITMCLMFVGAYCAFMAWPKYKYKGITEEESEEADRFREDFRRKFRR